MESENYNFVLVKNVYLFSQLFKFSLKFSLNLV